jgi:hypothetical protein
MEMTAVILYEGALAHYDVEIGRDGICTARLTRYNGNQEHSPAKEIVLQKEGRHWVANNNNFTLSDDLGYAIETKAKPILDERKRGNTHPAG